MNKRDSDEPTRQKALEELERIPVRFELVDGDRAVAAAAADMISELR